MDIFNLTIESKNLKYIVISSLYKEEIFTEFSQNITRYMFPQPANSIKEIEDYITKATKDWTKLQMVILNKETQEFVWCIGLINIHQKQPEINIWIKESLHGKWYWKECIMTIKNRAENNLNYEYILYPVAKENNSSIRIIEAIWWKLYKQYKWQNVHGKKIDLLEYRIYPINK